MSEVVLAVEGLTKTFGGLRAVDDLTIEVREGEVLGLIGPNGAGKTTLLNLISGLMPPTSGRIRLDGEDVTGKPPQRLRHMGLARTFQVVKPFTGLTVVENVAMGAMFGKTPLSVGRALARARETLAVTGLSDKAQYGTAQLTIADRKRLELARALAMDPRIILLDEVMAGLNPTEIEHVIELIQKLNGEGITIVVIEHVMKAIMTLSTRVVVLHHGAKLADGKPEEVTRMDAVIEAYLGRQYAERAGVARGDS